jgi:hypothetical protein
MPRRASIAPFRVTQMRSAEMFFELCRIVMAIDPLHLELRHMLAVAEHRAA